MGLLLSVLVTCVGVLEVIACYTHFRIGIAYNECKSNIRDIAKYYALELRKHELHFETPPPDADRGECSTSSKSTVRVQEKPGHGLHTDAPPPEIVDRTAVESTLSVSATPVEHSPNPAANLKVPRNSISGLDSPTIEQLTSPEINISEVIASTLQDHVNDEQFWTRKSPSPLPDKASLEIVDKDFWKSRSPSPLPENKAPDTGLIYTPGLRRSKSPLSPILKTSTSVPNSIHTFVADTDTVYTDLNSTGERPDLQKYPSLTDLEVQQILNVTDEDVVPRQPSPYPDVLFGLTDNQETKFDEDFLRSLDGVKSPKCDDKRRSFRKKRNSSSTSSRASRDETRSLTSLEEIDLESTKRSSIYQQQQSVRSDITPLLEETAPQYSTEMKEINENVMRTESVISENCESIQTPEPPVTISQNQHSVIVTKPEEPVYQSCLLPKTDSGGKETKSETGKLPGAEVSFTEKVKDLEISVQLMVTVKGASSGDKMEYTTNVSRDGSKQNSLSPKPLEEDSTTTTTEESGKFGHLSTSLTVGGTSSSKTPEREQEHKSATTNGFSTEDSKPNLKDMQISSQSLICSERASLRNTENEALKLYESFNELPEVEKNKFLRFIGRSKVIEEIEKSDGKKKTTKHVSSKSEPELSKTVVNETRTFEVEKSGQGSTPEKQATVSSTTEETKETSDKTINEGTKIDKVTETTSYEEKPKLIETLSKQSNDGQPKIDSSESSSETPSTAIENFMRRASQTSFEEANSSQNETMLRRRLSNSDVSPQQASQAFWVK